MLAVRIISIFLSILLLIGGLLVLLRNTQKTQNRYFFALCLLSAAWGTTFQNITSFHSLTLVRLSNEAAYAFGLLLMLSAILFSFTFPRPRPKKIVIWYSYILIPTLVLCFTPLIAGTATIASYSPRTYQFTYGILTPAYNIVMGIGILLVIKSLFFGRKKFDNAQKTQAKFTAFGFVLTFLFGVGFSTVLPLFFPNTTLDNLAPFSLIFLVGFSGLAIVRHKLFDFRAVIARAATYILTTLFVVAGYVGVGFLVKLILLPDVQVTTSQLTSNVALGVLLVLSYPSLKKRFDVLTNKLFYHDAYDTQSFLDELNKTLVQNVDIGPLLSKSAQVIENNFKASFCSFYIHDTDYSNSRVVGDTGNRLPKEQLDAVKDVLRKVHKKVVYVDDIDTGNDAERHLTTFLRQNKIEIIVRLVSDTKDDKEGIGYLLVGPKRSGSIYSKRDISLLEIIANELIIAVENALRFEEIEQFNVTLQQKVNDATRELKKSNEKLRELDQAKDEFISMASHQLRTPLTSVKGYLSMLDEGDAGKLNTTQKQFVDQAFVSSQRMVYLIADLLNVSRLKTGKFVIETKPTYLPDVIESEIAQLCESIKARGQTMTFDKPATFPTLNLDETKIRQVVMNFADNAVYYTPNGGDIRVSLTETPQSVEFTVKDDGIGVPKAEQHHLFTKFYRAGNARKSRPDGTGLGLYMAKKVVIAQGGALIFHSQEGKGSTFGFSFAKSKLMVPTPTPVNSAK